MREKQKKNAAPRRNFFKIIRNRWLQVKASKDIYFTRKKIVRLHRKSNTPIKVVFIAQFIPAWNKIDSIYKQMLEDERFEPKILCVPLNIQNNELVDADDLTNDTYEYFIEHNYEAINALVDKNHWYDLEELKPDYVFHARPYNSYMPQQYTSEKIRKYALLCNVLYGANTTKTGQVVSLNRGYFKDVFGFFAFDKYEKFFYEKKFKIGFILRIQQCLPYGATGLEAVMKLRDCERLSEDYKRVLWTPRWSTDPVIGGSNFFRYKNTILKLVEEHPNVQLIIRPHPMMFDNFLKTGEMTEKEVSDFKKFCEESSNVILDETKDYTKTFWQTDFIITDSSGIIPEYYVTNHPIIYCYSNLELDYTDYCREIFANSYEVHNEKELQDAFAQLCDNKDFKRANREKSIKDMFGEVDKCTENILETLAFWINGDPKNEKNRNSIV